MFGAEEQGAQPDPNKDIKIKLLDELVEKIMSLPDSEEAQEEKPAGVALEISGDLDPSKLKKD